MVAYSYILNLKSEENTILCIRLNVLQMPINQNIYLNGINPDTFVNPKLSCYSLNLAKTSLIFFLLCPLFKYSLNLIYVIEIKKKKHFFF